MKQAAILEVLKGYALAVLAALLLAAFAAIVTQGGAPSIAAWPQIVFAVLLSVPLLALAEARRIRGILFWPAAGALLLIAAGYLASAVTGATANGADRIATTISGLLSGYVYWRFAGSRAGRLWAALVKEKPGANDLLDPW